MTGPPKKNPLGIDGGKCIQYGLKDAYWNPPAKHASLGFRDNLVGVVGGPTTLAQIYKMVEEEAEEG